MIIYDEAHKASGKYPYTTINHILKGSKINYWVVALTATPGNDLEKIKKLIANLNISEIEIREE